MCRHPILVDGAGPFYDDVVCESCGYAKHPTCLSNWMKFRIYVGLTKIRKLKPGELFCHDGVHVPVAQLDRARDF